jgi:hypothetical protein
VGDDLVCDFKVGHGPDVALPYWGVGRVVRVDGCSAAIDLSAGVSIFSIPMAAIT